VDPTSPRRRALFDKHDRKLLALAVPVFFSLIAEPLYILVDTAIVGRISTAALGGLALAGSVLVGLTWICGFLATGVTTQVGQRLGAGDRSGAATAVSQGAWLALALSVVSLLGVEIGGPSLLRLLGGTGEVLTNAIVYLRISVIGIPAILFSLLALGWLRGSSNMKTPLVVAVVASLANVLLEVLFVYIFDMGIEGSAWGTVIVQWFAVAWLLRVVVRDVAVQPLRMKDLRGLVAIGGAMLVRTGAMVATITAATSFATRSGKATLAAHQVAAQTFSFLALAIDALAISTQTVFAEELGRGDITTLWPTTKRLVRLGTIAGVVIGSALAAVSYWVPALFSPDAEVQHQARLALALLAIMQVTGAIVFTLDGVLMGANLFTYLAVAAVAGGVGFVGVAVLGNAVPGSRITQIWIGMNVWMLIRLVGNSFIARKFLLRR
jgi:putative MATE family efflux protein